MTFENKPKTQEFCLESFDDDGILKNLEVLDADINEVFSSLTRGHIENIAKEIKKINLQELADILEVSDYIISTNHAGMLAHSFEHPTLGSATTIQTSGDGALLIKHL